MLRSQGVCARTCVAPPVCLRYALSSTAISRTSPRLTASRTTVTTRRLNIVSGPLPCVCDPTQSAKSGPPVQRFSEASPISDSSATRRTIGILSLVSDTVCIEIHHECECQGPEKTSDARRETGGDTSEVARGGRTGLPVARLRGL